eukprot:4760595-Prymnesium_polylepis.2
MRSEASPDRSRPAQPGVRAQRTLHDTTHLLQAVFSSKPLRSHGWDRASTRLVGATAGPQAGYDNTGENAEY